ncbi:unnamed protein product [Vitrella brassicaformis CCMP3155]|uniref:Uncharacterized protein n=1 Tax=Vitrella brassicaformis (strain CCMP3155) TaxID=1169540 RepID=A0A0G4GYG3_VITBC|nr:unnamed protein product [Vitrella brassicaformis CCMP3155]|eukprot:CEM36159.1 unnamed protein product [Vitrella brassicaformis CCMP3155]
MAPPPIERTMSVSSWALSRGLFPPQVNLPGTAINLCLHMKDLPLRDDLVKLFESHLLQYHRMRSVPSGWSWREVPVTVQAHFTEHTVRSTEDLHSTIEAVMDRPLDKTRPLWEVHLMSAVARTDTSSSCLVLRIDHAIADGLGVFMLLHQCGFIRTQAKDEVLPLLDLIGIRADTHTPATSTGTSESGTESEWTKVGGREQQPLVQGRRRSRTWFQWAVGVYHFIHALVAAIGHTLGRYDGSFSFNGGLGRRKRLTYGRRKLVVFPSLRLSYLKAIKKAAGDVSLTDVLLAIFTGAIRRYGGLVDDPLLKSEGGTALLRALTAFALPRLQMALPRSLDDDVPASRVLRQGFMVVSTQLPIHITDAKERLMQMAQETASLKSRQQPTATYRVLAAVGQLAPWSVTSRLLLGYFARHSFVASNVPGPRQLCTFAGKPVHDVQVVYPDLLPQLFFLSYAGRVRSNLIVDPDLWPQYDQLGALVVAEARELARAVGVTHGDPLQD